MSMERRMTEYGGRGYFSTDSIPAGTIVMTVPCPFASVIFRPFKKEVCAGCFGYQDGKSLKFKLDHPQNATKKDKQRVYGGLYFCSEQCKDGWTNHNDSDGLISSVLDLIEKQVTIKDDLDRREPQGADLDELWEEMTKKVLNLSPAKKYELESEEYDTARFVVWAVINKFRATCDDSRIPSWEEFELLQSNEQQKLSTFPVLVQSHMAVYKFLKSVLPGELNKLMTPQLVRETVGKEAGNAFGIWQLPLHLESECFGSALYPSASFFNHSCDPNVKKERVGNSMVFTTTRTVPANEQLCISYGMIDHLKVEERVSLLNTQWYFECKCTRCTTELALLVQEQSEIPKL